jgi:dihydrofolate synthase/folylpolyglutamate synthase
MHVLDRLFALETFGIKLGLDNIRRLCDALGHPERAFRSLHVAGTNGKGSVTAMAHAALHAAGLRAARYTSPHLSRLTERFVIGAGEVADSDLRAAAEDVLALADRLMAEGRMPYPPTFFEATTAIGFELFRRAAVDVAVVEVGLGGRFDATNVIMPTATAITTIAFDHQRHLGHTLAQIAFEKAGIIKPGRPVVVGPLPSEARAEVVRVAIERGAPIVDALDGTRVEAKMIDGRARLRLSTPAGEYGPLRLALRGSHQVANAIIAVRLLEAAAAEGLSITRQAIERGLETVEWPARLELLTLEGRRRVLLDAAHNDEGARALADYLRRWHPERPPLVIGVMRDKDVGAIADALLPAVSTVIATVAPSPRALPAEELAAQIERRQPERRVRAVADPAAAVDLALEEAPLVCVAGSIFLAGAVRDALRRRAMLR